MEYRSIAQLADCLQRNLHLVPPDTDLVVGVPRSGLLAANMLALFTNRALTDVEGLVERRVLKTGARGVKRSPGEVIASARRLLVVDDSVYCGKEMQRVRARVAQAGLQAQVLYAAVYVAPGAQKHVDIAFETVALPRIFQWNLLHHTLLSMSCFDIDGVLCVDPTGAQNDDGERYADFLDHASPLADPTGEIGWLVTARLEKYRPQTQRWLRAQGIQYRQLVMMDLPTQAARLARGSHASFKADVYQRCGARLFVESDPRQAREIARLSGRPVICFGTQQLIRPPLVQPLVRFPRRVYRRLRRTGRNLRDALFEVRATPAVK